jgi:hypothetical protein
LTAGTLASGGHAEGWLTFHTAGAWRKARLEQFDESGLLLESWPLSSIVAASK